MSVKAASDRVLVSRFVTPPLPGEGSANVQPHGAGDEVVAVLPTLAVERTLVLRHGDKPDSLLQGRGIPDYLAAAVISPDGHSAWVPSKRTTCVYLTLDNRYGAPVAWMAGWSDTGLKMATAENGTVTLGPAGQAGYSLYTVVVK